MVAWWGEGHKEPWYILTDLAPEGSDAQWYGLRGWCEQGFKCIKRGGWQWQMTQMAEPSRAERVWLALAVATLWVVSVGSELEAGSGTAGEWRALIEIRYCLSRASLTACGRSARVARSQPHPSGVQPQPPPVWVPAFRAPSVAARCSRAH